MKTTFEIEGFDVKTARDGRNIQKISSDFKPDLVVTDLMMPGVGGFDVIRQLQSDPVTNKVPVLLITGSNMNESTKSMMQMESNLVGYFEKPVRPETLLRKIHKLLNTASLSEQRAADSTKDYPTNFNDIF
ncbi:MAG: Response regulator PleD [Elusimicrobia bacterium]|nr:Response regulator PleD [Elusimicrobiota bacterium]